MYIRNIANGSSVRHKEGDLQVLYERSFLTHYHRNTCHSLFQNRISHYTNNINNTSARRKKLEMNCIGVSKELTRFLKYSFFDGSRQKELRTPRGNFNNWQKEIWSVSPCQQTPLYAQQAPNTTISIEYRRVEYNFTLQLACRLL